LLAQVTLSCLSFPYPLLLTRSGSGKGPPPYANLNFESIYFLCSCCRAKYIRQWSGEVMAFSANVLGMFFFYLFHNIGFNLGKKRSGEVQCINTAWSTVCLSLWDIMLISAGFGSRLRMTFSGLWLLLDIDKMCVFDQFEFCNTLIHWICWNAGIMGNLWSWSHLRRVQ
jgi:hypothetical protein